MPKLSTNMNGLYSTLQHDKTIHITSILGTAQSFVPQSLLQQDRLCTLQLIGPLYLCDYHLQQHGVEQNLPRHTEKEQAYGHLDWVRVVSDIYYRVHCIWINCMLFDQLANDTEVTSFTGIMNRLTFKLWKKGKHKKSNKKKQLASNPKCCTLTSSSKEEEVDLGRGVLPLLTCHVYSTPLLLLVWSHTRAVGTTTACMAMAVQVFGKI